LNFQLITPKNPGNEALVSRKIFRQILPYAASRGIRVAFDMTKISDCPGTEISGILGVAMPWMLEIRID
jgi:hypothetical protein